MSGDTPVNGFTNAYLIEYAASILKPIKLVDEGTAGDVSAVIVSGNQNLYTGVCIDVPCGMGFCAEHGAIASMVTAGETKIDKVVATWGAGEVIPPCGRCREFMTQIDPSNLKSTIVILAEDLAVSLQDLLPYAAQDYFDGKT